MEKVVTIGGFFALGSWALDYLSGVYGGGTGQAGGKSREKEVLWKKGVEQREVAEVRRRKTRRGKGGRNATNGEDVLPALSKKPRKRRTKAPSQPNPLQSEKERGREKPSRTDRGRKAARGKKEVHYR